MLFKRNHTCDCKCTTLNMKLNLLNTQCSNAVSGWVEWALGSPIKGQLISKAIYGLLNSPKNERNALTQDTSLLSRLSDL